MDSLSNKRTLIFIGFVNCFLLLAHCVYQYPWIPCLTREHWFEDLLVHFHILHVSFLNTATCVFNSLYHIVGTFNITACIAPLNKLPIHPLFVSVHSRHVHFRIHWKQPQTVCCLGQFCLLMYKSHVNHQILLTITASRQFHFSVIDSFLCLYLQHRVTTTLVCYFLRITTNKFLMVCIFLFKRFS